MKQLLPVVLLAVMLAIATSAMAGSKSKPPNTLCLEWKSVSHYHQLSFTAIGNIFDDKRKLRIYAVAGVDQYGIISGSGYVIPDTKILLATYSGMHSGDTVSNYELEYDLKAEEGTVYYRYDTPPNNALVTGSDSVYDTQCKELNLPTE
jgi:hypothetical protein